MHGGMTDPTYASDAEPTAPGDDRRADEERPSEEQEESVALGGAGFGVVGPEDVHDDPAAEPGVGDAI
jgi:hypothetical protein